MADRVLVEILVAAPIDTVRTALAEPDEVIRWFGWEYPDLLRDTKTMWQGLTVDATGRVLATEGEADRFTLEPLGDQTIVRVIRSAPAADGWRGIYDDVAEGWITFFHQLKFALERHAGEARRTLYLNGRAKAAESPNPIEALGVAPVWVVPVGETYERRVATGDTLTGTVLYRTGHQLGVTVSAWGDGLLIANLRPRTAKSAHGGGALLLTTYGMSDDAFKELRERWIAWWTSAYEVIETT
jgi:hypothetical protein